MNGRQRFRRLMRYEPLDRLPVMALEPFEPTAIERWCAEGLPADADPVDYLGMSRLVYVPLNFHPLPGFAPDVVAEDETYCIRRSPMGALVRHRKDNPTLFYGHIDHPVRTRADWEEYRQRFDADAPGRRPADWLASALPGLQASEHPVGVCLFPFFFRLGFYAMGMERFLLAFYEEPALMHEVFSYWSDFVLRLLHPVLDAVPLDFALFAEDLAGKNGPLISPRIYQDFWLPYQDPIVRLLQEHGVPVICQWTAGQPGALLPIMLDHGFNCTWPLEVTAGMDAPALRRQFGRNLLLGGNIAKEAVIAGPEAVDAEIERLLPLIREGGFLPALDDMASPDMPFSHYRYLIETLQAIPLSEVP